MLLANSVAGLPTDKLVLTFPGGLRCKWEAKEPPALLNISPQGLVAELQRNLVATRVGFAVEQVAEFAELGAVVLAYKKEEEELKLAKRCFQDFVEELVKKQVEFGIAEEQAVEPGTAELAAGLVILLGRLAVENSMVMAAYNLVGGWAGTSEDNFENTAASQVGVSVDNSEQIVADSPFEAVAKNSGDILLVGLTYKCQAD